VPAKELLSRRLFSALACASGVGDKSIYRQVISPPLPQTSRNDLHRNSGHRWRWDLIMGAYHFRPIEGITTMDPRNRRFASLVIVLAVSPAVAAEKPVAIGSRLELFADGYLIGKLSGDAKLKLHEPKPHEVVLVTGKPWEGNTCAYYTIFQEGKKYRMYYRGSHWDTAKKRATHLEVTCYAESSDGIHWTKPNLGLFEFNGSKKNNIVWNGIGTHCFTPFIDTNPDCPADAKYKAISRGRPRAKKGLYAFGSADGIHWKLMSKQPVITLGAFDSQNLAFWDPARKRYVAYYRNFRNGMRDIMTCTSNDFLHWSKPQYLKISGAPREHLYTNAVRPYPRAPHLKIGFPTRYLPQGSKVAPTFMLSRDGLNFHRWQRPVIPNTAPKDRDGNRSNYMTWGLLQLPGKPREYSVYATEAYYTGPDSRVRRFTYRVDGFVSVHSGEKGGELVTKPLTFTGQALVLNSAANRNGSLKVELQDAAGKPISGFTASDCKPLTGDEIAGKVTFAGGDVGKLAGKTVRLRFVLKNADLYSLRFAK
jgi:hypothetical protein